MTQAVLIAVISAIGGGFLVKLLTFRADNKHTEELTNNVIYDGWQKLYNAQKSDLEEMRKEISDLRARQILLEQSNSNYKRIITLAYGCSHKNECPVVQSMAEKENETKTI